MKNDDYYLITRASAQITFYNALVSALSRVSIYSFIFIILTLFSTLDIVDIWSSPNCFDHLKNKQWVLCKHFLNYCTRQIVIYSIFHLIQAIKELSPGYHRFSNINVLWIRRIRDPKNSVYSVNTVKWHVIIPYVFYASWSCQKVALW